MLVTLEAMEKVKVFIIFNIFALKTLKKVLSSRFMWSVYFAVDLISNNPF